MIESKTWTIQKSEHLARCMSSKQWVHIFEFSDDSNYTLCWYVFKAGELNHWKIQKNMNTLLCSHMFWALKSCLSSIARWKRQKTYMGMAAMLEHQMTSMFIFLIFQCASVDKRSNHWNTQKYEHGSHVRTSMVSMFIFLKFPMVHISPIQFNGQIHPPLGRPSFSACASWGLQV